MDDFGDPVHGIGFAAPDIDISGDGLAHRAEFRFRFTDQFEDFACPLAQEHPFRRQNYMVASPHKKRLAELSFQIHHLTRERWLRDMQSMCGRSK